MLLTLASLSGSYCIANQIFVRRNKNLLQYNEFLSLRGRKTITHFNYENSHKINYINYIRSNKLSNDRLTDIYKIQNFNNPDECKNFCIDKNLKFDNTIYNQLVIDDENSSNVWILYNNSKEYTIIRNMSLESFKKEIINTNRLPFSKLNIILFMVLMIIFYESNLSTFHECV